MAVQTKKDPPGIDGQTVKGFVQSLLLRSFDDAVESPPCHLEWWDAFCSKHKFVAIAAPRGFAKSTALTHAYTLAKLLFRESRFILVVSDSESQASMFLNDIKKELTDNEALRALFGVDKLLKDAETDCIVLFKDGKQARILAKGSEQKLRGLKWLNLRPDLIICDDMENDELVMNKERREKLKKWFSTALLPVRSNKGIIRIVGTILHHESLLNSFMPSERAKDTIDTGLKVYTRKPSQWLAVKYRAHTKNFEQLLWPTRHTKESLIQTRGVYEAQGRLDSYSQEYLNDPLYDDATHFRQSDFRDEEDQDKDKPLTYYITFDLATKSEQRTDWSVFLVSGVDADGVVHLKHLVRGRFDSLEQAEILFTLVKMYEPQMCITEKGLLANSILPSINKMMHERQLYFRIELFPTIVDKLQRSQAIQLRARAGMVKVPKKALWWADFEDECLKFPRLGHDDQVDAFSLIGQALNKFYEAPTQEEKWLEEFEEEMQRNDALEDGRSELTGY